MALTSSKEPAAVTNNIEFSIRAEHVLYVRVLLETRGQFHDFEAWAGAIRAAAGGASVGMGRRACKSLLGSMGEHERLVTHRLLSAGTGFRLQADSLGRTWQVEIGRVI